MLFFKLLSALVLTAAAWVGPHSARPREAAAGASLPIAGAFRWCRPQGWGPNPALSRQKNRWQPALHPQKLNVNYVNSLPVPSPLPLERRDWNSTTSAAVARQEARAVQVSGYLVGYNHERFEAGNCYRPDLWDEHLYIGATPGATHGEAMIAEITPRWRSANPGWNLHLLRRLLRRQARIRVTGWLMLDEAYGKQVGVTRGGLWEVHPVTNLQIRKNGHWQEPAARRIGRRARSTNGASGAPLRRGAARGASAERIRP